MIEILVVLLIASIMAAAVTLRISGPAQAARLGDIVEQIAEYHYLCGNYAREHDKAVLMAIDVSAGCISRLDETSEELGSTLQLPESYAITRLMTADCDIAAGSISLRFSRKGFSRSIAMLVEHTGRQDQGQKQWMVLTGLGGQLILIDDDDRDGKDAQEKVREILAASQLRGRHDAD